jgi:RNA polymerase sigma-70 factor (ECF subfamily)
MKEMAVATEVVLLRQRDFADFYRLRRTQVFRALALTLRDDELAADAVDEAMARAYERWRSVCGYVNPEGWVYRVGLNWARSRMRRVRREVLTSSPPELSRSDRLPDPDLDRALAALSIEARSVVVLRHYVDLTVDQIAAVLEIPLGTAKSRLHYAMRELRRRLEVEA